MSSVGDLRPLAEEQAALRRVATLVAGGAAPEGVFAAVTEEIGQLLPVDASSMGRYESDDTVTFVGNSNLAIDCSRYNTRPFSTKTMRVAS